MPRFHKPGAEKRSVAVLRPEQYDDWLGCRSTNEARSFLSLFPADEMAAVPAPIYRGVRNRSLRIPNRSCRVHSGYGLFPYVSGAENLVR